MRLRVRIILFLTVATLVPVAVLGAAAVQIATRRLDARVSALQARTADGLAVYVDTWLEARRSHLEQQASSLPVATLDPTAQVGFLRLTYRQQTDLGAVALLDAQGDATVPPALLRPGQPTPKDPALQGRLRLGPDQESAFLERVQDEAHPPWTAPWMQDETPVVAVRTPVGDTDLSVAGEVSLRTLRDRFVAVSGPQLGLALLDREGRPVLGGDHELIVPDYFRAFLGTSAVEGIRYALPDGTRVLAAASPVTEVGWTVVVAEPEQVTAAAGADIRSRTAFVGLVAAAVSLVLGALFSRQLSRPVVAVKDAALQVAAGARVQPLPEGGQDEIAELSRAFNFMSARLAESAKEIATQQAEIQAFNDDLQERVAQRTAELRQAQAQLVQSARLAATGELGASLAHELNNPLAGILGLVQILRQRADSPMLESVEEQALRCSAIVTRLTELGAPPASVGTDLTLVSAVFNRVASLTEPLLAARDLTLQHAAPDGLRMTADPAMEHALTQLLLSVRAAATGPGSLTLEAQTAQGGIQVSLHLRARAVRLQGDDWRAGSLGTWAAHQALAARGGTLESPAPPEGAERATWVVHIPS